MLPTVIMSGSVEGAAQFITVFLIFLAVLAVTYLTTRFIGNYQKSQGQGRNFEAIETYRVTANRFLQIVRVGRRYFLIAVAKDDISLISELKEDDFDISGNEHVVNDRFKQILDCARDKITKRGDKQ
ncbi:MAG: flagellar biosynthetic protein FliO [Lachnospiraceae bacterium]|nr:flagellar biosynthetic protein FliO [Lachnospiraceae bacterium]